MKRERHDCQIDRRKPIITSVCIEAKIAIVLYLPRTESARKPPSKQRRKQVPMKSVTMLAEVALGKCIVPTKYVTRLTAIPIVESLSHSSIPAQDLMSLIHSVAKTPSNLFSDFIFCTVVACFLVFFGETRRTKFHTRRGIFVQLVNVSRN